MHDPQTSYFLYIILVWRACEGLPDTSLVTIGTGSSILDVDCNLIIMQDPFVKQANLDQYRSRSAYKLIELDDKFHFLRRGSIVVRILRTQDSTVHMVT